MLLGWEMDWGGCGFSWSVNCSVHKWGKWFKKESCLCFLDELEKWWVKPPLLNSDSHACLFPHRKSHSGRGWGFGLRRKLKVFILFQWAWQNGSRKEGWEKDRSVPVVMTRQYTISIHKYIHGMSFKNCILQAFRSGNLPRRRWELQVNWARGIRNVPYGIWVPLFRKCN